MFHDLRDWMLALQLLGVREVDFSITRKTKKIGLGRVLHGKRILDLARRAGIRLDLDAVNADHCGSVLAHAYPDRIAVRRSQPGQFQMRSGSSAWTPPTDPLAWRVPGHDHPFWLKAPSPVADHLGIPASALTPCHPQQHRRGCNKQDDPDVSYELQITPDTAARRQSTSCQLWSGL